MAKYKTYAQRIYDIGDEAYNNSKEFANEAEQYGISYTLYKKYTLLADQHYKVWKHCHKIADAIDKMFNGTGW